MRADKQQLSALLDGMIRMLSSEQHRQMGETMEKLSQELGVTQAAVYKWRQGVFAPGLDAIHRLVRVGVTEAGMNREWAEEVLTLTHHPQQAALLAELFPLPSARPASQVRYGLPNRPFQMLYGRERELAAIFERLTSSSRHWIIPITGPGGVGKTALALEVAWRLVESADHQIAGAFDAVIYASASRYVIDAHGVAARPAPTLRSLDDLILAIPDALEGDPSFAVTPAPRSRSERVRAAMRALRRVGRALVIVDDLDALEDDDMRAVLHFLRDLPSPTKSLVTARFHEDLPYPLQVASLEREALESVLEDECDAHLVSLDESARTQLLAAADGNPLTIQWLVWQIARHKPNIDLAVQLDVELNRPLHMFLEGAHRHPSFTPMRQPAKSLRSTPALAMLPRRSASRTSERTAFDGADDEQEE